MEPIVEEDKKADMIATIVKYFRLHRGTHSLYAFRWDTLTNLPKMIFLETAKSFDKYVTKNTATYATVYLGLLYSIVRTLFSMCSSKGPNPTI